VDSLRNIAIMRVAIFGGAGFIGTNIIELLSLEDDAELFCFDNLSAGNQLLRLNPMPKVSLWQGDMTIAKEVNEFVRTIKPHKIFHLVANSDIASASQDASLDYSKTFQTTCNLVNALSKNPLCELVFASSSAVYGPHKKSVIESADKNPISSYGWMKLASEVALTSAFEAGKISKLLITRFPNVTGKYQTHGVLFDLINQIRRSPDRLEVLGNGSQTKPYMDAQELSGIIFRLINTIEDGITTVNISTTDCVSVREIVEMILMRTQLNPEVIFQQSEAGWIGDIPSYQLEISQLRSLLPDWHPKSSIEAIRSGIEYMWRNYVAQ